MCTRALGGTCRHGDWTHAAAKARCLQYNASPDQSTRHARVCRGKQHTTETSTGSKHAHICVWHTSSYGCEQCRVSCVAATPSVRCTCALTRLVLCLPWCCSCEHVCCVLCVTPCICTSRCSVAQHAIMNAGAHPIASHMPNSRVRASLPPSFVPLQHACWLLVMLIHIISILHQRELDCVCAQTCITHENTPASHCMLHARMLQAQQRHTQRSSQCRII